ncbi:hypothetical protein [Streptomyces sp. G45]|uniref:hypothetical protein n=1 Tax=Streptomyces sp. G45 TaxID=3406627 RepID=UPI003C1C30A9
MRTVARMPLVVAFAVAGVFLQAVVHAWSAVGVLRFVDDRLAHGQDVPDAATVRAVMYAWIALAGGMALVGLGALLRYRWTRIAVIAVECVLALLFLLPLGYLALLAPLVGTDLLEDAFGLTPRSVILLVCGLLAAVAIGRAMFCAAAVSWFTR